MAQAALDAANLRSDNQARWHLLWDAEIAELPSPGVSPLPARLRPAAAGLGPAADREHAGTRLTSDDEVSLIGCVPGAEQVCAVRAGFGLDGGPSITGAKAFEVVMERGHVLALANGWRLMGGNRVEIEGPADTDLPDLPGLRRLGCTVEIVSWRTRVFVPNADTRSNAFSTARRLISLSNAVASPPTAIHIAGQAAAGTAATRGETP